MTNSDTETTNDAQNETQRPGPLNLTREEAEYLWEMMKRQVGKKHVQESDKRDVAESLHTKVSELQSGRSRAIPQDYD